jgi:quinol monooxygenase YgiN
MPSPVKIVAILTARPGKTAELRGLLDGMVAPSREEPGNLRWDIWQDQADSSRFMLDELYVDKGAAAAHRETPHFRRYAGRVDTLAERTPLTLDPVAIA